MQFRLGIMFFFFFFWVKHSTPRPNCVDLRYSRSYKRDVLHCSGEAIYRKRRTMHSRTAKIALVATLALAMRQTVTFPRKLQVVVSLVIILLCVSICQVAFRGDGEGGDYTSVLRPRTGDMIYFEKSHRLCSCCVTWVDGVKRALTANFSSTKLNLCHSS